MEAGADYEDISLQLSDLTSSEAYKVRNQAPKRGPKVVCAMCILLLSPSCTYTCRS